MYNTLLSGPWMNILKQYSTVGLTPLQGGPSSGQTMQAGAFGKAVTITPSNTTVVDRMQAGLIRACDSGSTWLGIDVVFATGTNAAGVQCRAIRATAFL
jgi:hypothetical protein